MVLEGVELPRLGALERVLFYPINNIYSFRAKQYTSFTPLFCHHFFPVDEKIIGFDDVYVHIYFLPTTFEVYIHLEGAVSSKAPNPLHIKQSLMHALTKQVLFPGSICTTPEEFEQKILEVHHHHHLLLMLLLLLLLMLLLLMVLLLMVLLLMVLLLMMLLLMVLLLLMMMLLVLMLLLLLLLLTVLLLMLMLLLMLLLIVIITLILLLLHIVLLPLLIFLLQLLL